MISSCDERILCLFTYAKIEYVSVRTYLSKNRIRTLRILEHWFTLLRNVSAIGTVHASILNWNGHQWLAAGQTSVACYTGRPLQAYWRYSMNKSILS